jgi:Fic family protein
MDNLKAKLNKIDDLKKELAKLAPLRADIAKSLKSDVDDAIIYNSTLGKCSNSEDKKILEKAHKEALGYINELSKKNISELNKVDILKIHYILYKDMCPNFAGNYRDSEVWVSSKGDEEKYAVCPYLLIKDEMDNFFSWLFSKKNEHPLIIAAEAHVKFVSIHPFIEGNGKTGRLIMNLILLQNGYTPIIIKAYREKEKYNDAIKIWRNGEKNDFYNLIADCEIESLKRYLEKIKNHKQ